MLTILRSYLSRIQRIYPFQYLNLSSASAMPCNVMILAIPVGMAISTHDNIGIAICQGFPAWILA
jgi:hypothetical protein